MTTQQKLIKAWSAAPYGAKAIVYKKHTQQNVADILKNGRKNEELIVNLLQDVKEASNMIALDIAKHNKKVQAI